MQYFISSYFSAASDIEKGGVIEKYLKVFLGCVKFSNFHSCGVLIICTGG